MQHPQYEEEGLTLCHPEYWVGSGQIITFKNTNSLDSTIYKQTCFFSYLSWEVRI